MKTQVLKDHQRRLEHQTEPVTVSNITESTCEFFGIGVPSR